MRLWKKTKYVFNPQTLRYELAKTSVWVVIANIFSYLITGLGFAVLTIYVAYNFFDSPKEKLLKKEIEILRTEYNILQSKMNKLELALNELQERDKNIYRVILEAEPMPDEIRKAGFGGKVNKEWASLENADIIKQTQDRLLQLSKQFYIQSRSLDEIAELAKNKSEMLSSIPAIIPIKVKDLKKQVTSGFGWRVHPIYKTQEFHPGLDFPSNQGTPVYATGNGKVEFASMDNSGYGLHVIINHGFGYQTLYGHLSKLAVRVGEKVKRGQLIGYVGSTGLSTAPHLHYEVIKNNEKVNPINYIFSGISEEEYAILVERANQSTQSFD
ncbi:MAG: peptidoglycan DD-metalloendopeptidase family protein [Bacteroidota bacterium]